MDQFSRDTSYVGPLVTLGPSIWIFFYVVLGGLHVWWSTKSWLATLLTSLIACQWVDSMMVQLKDLLIDEMVGA